MSAFTREQGLHARRTAVQAPRGSAPSSSADAGPDPAWVWDVAPGVHPTAVIHPKAEIHPEARIGPYCVVGPGVRIGARTSLAPHVVVYSDTVMGADNRVHSFAAIGHDPQDLKYRGEETRLEIGDRNIIREHATLHRGTGVGGGVTRVGSDNLLMVGAHVAHDCVIEDHVILANGVMLGGHVLVETGATIAGAAAVHHFATIGRLAFVGGLARVSKDVPPFIVVEGHPAEPRKVNSVALTRRGWAPADVESLRLAFKALFRARSSRRGATLNGAPGSHAGAEQETSETGTRDGSPGSVQAVIARLRADPTPRPATLELCDFLEKMQAGVHGRWRETLRERQGSARG